VRRLDRGQYALRPGEPHGRRDRFRVGDRDVAGAPQIPQVRMLGADAGVVQPGRDRVRLLDLPVLVLEEQRLEAVQYADLAVRGAGTAFGLDADELRGRVGEAREGARRVAAPADAGDDVIGDSGGQLGRALPPGLVAWQAGIRDSGTYRPP
jgi:hypothetical protein